MKCGSLVFATQQGLGYLAKSFYDHGIVTHPAVVSYTARGARPMHLEWYPGAPVINDLYSQQLRDFVLSVDVMLFFETAFDWGLIDHCRANGVKTVLMPMHECLHDKVWQHLPDLFLCPSALDFNVVSTNWRYGNMHVRFLPVPVEVPWRQRTRAEVFIHNAGHGGLKGRNGTRELVDAMLYVKSPAKLILRYQSNDQHFPGSRNIIRDTRTLTLDELWHDGGEGDVFVFPEKFNGLSLPLQEARAAGMLVMGSDRFPMNTWLPTKVVAGEEIANYPDGSRRILRDVCYTSPLIPVKAYKRGQRTFPRYHEFDEAVVDPRDIAAKIDEWYGKDITEYSQQGKTWAESMSWKNLKPQYLAVLEQLLSSAKRK